MEDLFRYWNAIFISFVLVCYIVQHKRMWPNLPDRRKALVFAGGLLLFTFIEGTIEVLAGVQFPARIGLVFLSGICMLWAIIQGRVTADDGLAPLNKKERAELNSLRSERRRFQLSQGKAPDDLL